MNSDRQQWRLHPASDASPSSASLHVYCSLSLETWGREVEREDRKVTHTVYADYVNQVNGVDLLLGSAPRTATAALVKAPSRPLHPSVCFSEGTQHLEPYFNHILIFPLSRTDPALVFFVLYFPKMLYHFILEVRNQLKNQFWSTPSSCGISSFRKWTDWIPMKISAA